MNKKKSKNKREKIKSCAPLPRQVFVFASACARVFVYAQSYAPASVCVCILWYIYLLLLFACVRGLPYIVVPVRNFWKIPVVLVPLSVAAFEISRISRVRGFGFLFIIFFCIPIGGRELALDRLFSAFDYFFITKFVVYVYLSIERRAARVIRTR